MVWPIWYAGPNEIMLVVTSPMNFKSKLAQKPIAELQDLHDKINENSNPFIFKIDMSRYR